MKRIFLIFTICGLLFSCSTGDETPSPITPPDPTTPPEPPTPPEPEAKTPINLSIESKVSISNGDKIGMYVVNEGSAGLGTTGNHVNNMAVTYSGNNWNPAQPMYWKDKNTRATFYCYYPYATSISSIDDYKFTVKTDQATNDNYKSSIFLWGKKDNVTPTKSTVHITMNQLTSNLIVQLVPGKGYSEEELTKAKVKICGIASSASINLSDGSITAIGEPTDIIPYYENYKYHTSLIPQYITKRPLIEVTLGEETYTLETSINFESAKEHTCTVKVNKQEQGFYVGITGWATDGIDYGGEAN